MPIHFFFLPLSTFCPEIILLEATQSLAFILLKVGHIETSGVQKFLDKSGILRKQEKWEGQHEEEKDKEEEEDKKTQK